MTNNCFGILRGAALSALFALLALSGCKKDEQTDKDYLSVTPKSLSLHSDGERKSVAVRSSSDWTAKPSADWVEITKSGSGNAFSVQAPANPYDEVRRCVITVTSLSGLTEEVAVSQTGIVPALEVDRNSVELDAEGTAAAIAVTSNIELSVRKDAEWLDATLEDGNLVVSAEPTPLFEQRSGKITLVPVMEEYAGLAKEISVRQAALKYSVLVAGQDIENGAVTVDADEKSLVLSVTANSSWTAECDADWIELTPSEGEKTDKAGVSVLMNIAENTETEPRSANAVFVCGDAKHTVAVTQRGSGIYLEVDDSDIVASDARSQFKRGIQTNGTLSFDCSQSWVSAGVEDGQIVIVVESNSGAERSATVTVKSTAGETVKTAEIAITQMAFAVDLSEKGTANCYVVNKAGMYKIKATVKGNGAETIGLERVKKSIEPNGAMIVWTTDTTGCIDDVTLFDDYIYFRTNGAAGNAVIAASHDEYSLNPDEPPFRTILWSWHIWMTDFDLDDPMNHYEVGGDALGLHSTLMGRNLGALSSGESGREDDLLGSFGLQYQWGRKDPFPGAIAITFDPMNEDMTVNGSGARSENAEIFYYRTDTGEPQSTKGAMWLYNYQVEDESVARNVEYSVENPEYFIKSANTAYIWCTSTAPVTGQTLNPLDEKNPWGYLWGNPNTTATSIADKSIYDPCPAGWQVPSSGQWYFITAHGSDLIWVYGYNSRWKYNHVEGRTATIKDISAGAREHNNDWTYLWNNTVIRMKDMDGGFNIFYTTHNEGVMPDGGDRFDVMETTHEADGPTMFLPAAGLRNYFGELRRVGFGCHYWCSGIRSTDLNKNERLQANAVNIDYQGNLIASFASDFNQQVCSRSVRCVKIVQ